MTQVKQMIIGIGTRMTQMLWIGADFFICNHPLNLRLLNKKHNPAAGANLLREDARRGDARRASLQTATRLNHDFHRIFGINRIMFAEAINPANCLNCDFRMIKMILMISAATQTNHINQSNHHKITVQTMDGAIIRPTNTFVGVGALRAILC
ncbi:MAG: hypothetical protein LBD59_01090 [Prevotellaceae bacterium]|nr:hypothetical protein [Prevotellaceae bacterium]